MSIVAENSPKLNSFILKKTSQFDFCKAFVNFDRSLKSKLFKVDVNMCVTLNEKDPRIEMSKL